MTSNNYMQLISMSLFVGINSLFILKYGLRLLPSPLVYGLLVLYIALVCLLYLRMGRVAGSLNTKFQILFVALILIILIIVQAMIDPLSIRVDRWSAIHNFNSYLLQGKYPYAAQTHLGGYGSPFPVWQIVHLPFFLLGNVGLSFLVASILFLDGIRRLYGWERAFRGAVLLLFSPAFIYEIMVRSDMLSNFLICAAIILYFIKFRVRLPENIVIIGIVAGLMTSTRLSALIPFIVYYFPAFIKMKFRKQLLFCLILVATFLITFLPFALWDAQMLFGFEFNPFILQSRQGNLSDLILFIPLGIWLSLTWKQNLQRMYFNTGILLVSFLVLTFLHNMWNHENWRYFFYSSYDITYFNMALPFLILSMILPVKDKKETPSVACQPNH